MVSWEHFLKSSRFIHWVGWGIVLVQLFRWKK